MRFYIVLVGLIYSTISSAINISFNQAWFHNHYAGQYLDSYFDESEVDRIFHITSLAGSKKLRLWFFESSDFPMIEWQGDQILGLKPDYIKNVIRTLELANKHHVKVYMTFFDAHAYRPDQLNFKKLKKLRNIYQGEGAKIFLRKIIAPLFKEINENGLAQVISEIDLGNEFDTVVNRFGFDGGWKGAGQMICSWREFINHLPGFNQTPVTLSVRLHPLLTLPPRLFSKEGPFACADFYDFHSYSDKSKIHACSLLKEYSTSPSSKRMILGEFGISYFNSRYDDELHTKNTKDYIQNAKDCGFKEALAWRLSDIRPGYNKEARYSFEAYGKMRPAFEVIRQNNQASE